MGVKSVRPTKRREPFFSDLSPDFETHRGTGDPVVLYDEAAVRAAVRRAVLTDRYEVPYNPQRGGDVRRSLFESVGSEFALNELRQSITQVLRNDEPRIDVQGVEVRAIGTTEVEIRVVYAVRNTGDRNEATLTVKRIR